MTLSELKNGQAGLITKIRGRGGFRKRIIEMGFIKGKVVRVIKNAPLRDPIEYMVMGYYVSLRRSEASLIDVIEYEESHDKYPDNKRELTDHTLQSHSSEEISTPERQNQKSPPGEQFSLCDEIPDPICLTAEEKHKIINVALVGNPNCGKTTLFNHASGSRERVGNYSGVTVEAKEAVFRLDGYTINIVDLPGTYSLTAYTPEELFVRNHIIDTVPDVVVNIIDATNLERNLYLTTQLIDMDIKVVVALNMHDALDKMNDSFDHDALGKMIGIPFVPTVGSKGLGVKELFRKVIDVYEDRDPSARHIHIDYGHDLEHAIHAVQGKLRTPENLPLTDRISSRFLSIKLLEKDRDAEGLIMKECPGCLDIIHAARTEIEKVEAHLIEDTETLITDSKYAFIAGALRETYRPSVRPLKTQSEKIDAVLTHAIFGLPIFFFLMWAAFQATFTIGNYPVEGIKAAIGFLSHVVSEHMPAGILKDLIVDGIIGGVGGVIVFLPNILILFFIISLMEDTGYMARAVFIMDRVMHKIGLHGKSFIPLVIGFGCNVPAIMATRTLESRNDRLLTMLIVPFMSCSARLPVFVLFIGTFFPVYSGSMLFLVYILGMLVAAVSAKILKKVLFSSDEIPFVMELPVYRMPHMKTTAAHMWHKGSEYLKKIGSVILVASIIIWALGKFPLNSGIDVNEEIRLEKSYIGSIGHIIEPIMRPLGFDWKIGVCLASGLAAKEIVVSTMGVMYGASGEHVTDSGDLTQRLRESRFNGGEYAGQQVFTPLTAFCLIIFVLIYSPCAAVIATIKRESGSWRWALFAAVYTTTLAWLLTFAVRHVGLLFM